MIKPFSILLLVCNPNIFLSQSVISEEILEDTLKLSKNFINRLEAVNLAHFALLVVEVDDRHRLVLEGGEALAKGLDVVIISAASLGALLNALDHGVLISIEEDTEGDIN